MQAGIINDEIRRLKAKYQEAALCGGRGDLRLGAPTTSPPRPTRSIVDKASIVGSIGVLMDGFGFTGLMDKLGVERRLLTAGENKGFLDPFSPQTDKQRAYAQAMLDQIHQQFIDAVQGRPRQAAEGNAGDCSAACSGPASRRSSWAWPTSFGNLDYVAREVVKAEDLVDYTPTDNVAERLAKRFGASIGEGAVRALRSMAPIR